MWAVLLLEEKLQTLGNMCEVWGVRVLNGLDLFSGVGGLTLALAEWVRPIAYCENNRYAQAVLLSNMGSGLLPEAPIWDDIKTLSRSSMPGLVDIIYGGFPCQDISSSGNGQGLEGKQSSLFYECVRLADECKPTFVFLENVSRIRTRGLAAIIKEFSSIGYDCRWTMLSALSVGAPHKRERFFFLAHANYFDGHKSGKIPGADEKEELPKISWQNKADKPSDAAWWKTEPSVARVANGLPYQMDRIRGLANAVVPQQAKQAFKELMGL